jgi:hypothetical protein
LRLAQRTTAVKPMMSRRRSVRTPIRDVRPSRSLPPVERWFQVAKFVSAAERLRCWRHCLQCGSNHRTDTGHAHQATGRIVSPRQLACRREPRGWKRLFPSLLSFKSGGGIPSARI